MDFFGAGIPLGRWFRIQVLLHWMFLLYIVFRLMNSREPVIEGLWLGVLFATVLVHEFGHALTCRSVGGEAHRIILWPLGGLAFVQPPPRPWPAFWTTVGGPATHLLMGPFWFVIAQFVVPYMGESLMREYLYVAAVFGIQINVALLIFNLIPAYPMDGGRILQEVAWMIVGLPRSLQLAGMVGTVAGIGFVVLGLGLATIRIPWIGYEPGRGIVAQDFVLGGQGSMFLAVIGIMAAMESFAIYKRAQEMASWRRN